jgi:O-antigen ligase
MPGADGLFLDGQRRLLYDSYMVTPLALRLPRPVWLSLSLVALVLLFEVLFARIIVFPASNAKPFILVAALAVAVFVEPLVGVLGYVIFYPSVGFSSGITSAEITAFGTSAVMMYAWFIHLFKGTARPGLARVVWWAWVPFFFWGALTFVAGVAPGVTVFQWMSDIVPYFNVLLIAAIAELVPDRSRQRWLAATVFGVFIIGIAHSGSVVLSRAGLIGFITPYLGYSSTGVMFLFILFTGLAAIWQGGRTFWGGILLALFGLAVVYFGVNRTMWVAAALGVLVLGLIVSRRKLLTGVLAATVVLGAWLIPSMVSVRGDAIHDLSSRRETMVNLNADHSFMERVRENQQLLDEFKQSPITGKGVGYEYHFWRAWLRGTNLFITNFAHNDLLNVMAKTGVIGLSLFLFALYIWFRQIWRGVRPLPPSWTRAVGVGLFVTLLMSIVSGLAVPVFQHRKSTFALVVLSAWFLARAQSIREELAVGEETAPSLRT